MLNFVEWQIQVVLFTETRNRIQRFNSIFLANKIVHYSCIINIVWWKFQPFISFPLKLGKQVILVAKQGLSSLLVWANQTVDWWRRWLNLNMCVCSFSAVIVMVIVHTRNITSYHSKWKRKILKNCNIWAQSWYVWQRQLSYFLYLV